MVCFHELICLARFSTMDFPPTLYDAEVSGGTLLSMVKRLALLLDFKYFLTPAKG